MLRAGYPGKLLETFPRVYSGPRNRTGVSGFLAYQQAKNFLLRYELFLTRILTGLTCTRHIREMERDGKLQGPRIPIIAVSANARTEQIVEAKDAGCDDVLVKPFRLPELIEKMTTVVRGLGGEAQILPNGGGSRPASSGAREQEQK